MPRKELRLVDYDRRYLDASWHWLKDPEIQRLTLTPDFTREEQLAFFEQLTSRIDYLIWGVEFASKPIGAAGIKAIREGVGEYWGYIGEKELWGRGLGSRLVDLVEEKCRAIGLSRVDLQVSPDNDRAIRLYDRKGFLRVGTAERVILMTKIL